MLAAFFFYGVKTLRRAANTRDQLLVIALMSAMATHFIEIQTGIQIASTWTYFYLLVGMMAAFGYYISGHLRNEAARAVPVMAGAQNELAQPRRGDGATRAMSKASLAQPIAAAKQPVAASAQAKTQKTVAL